MNIKKTISYYANKVMGKLGYEIKKKHADFYLHQYSSYDEYKEKQIYHNKKKLQNVWADEATLDLVIERVKNEYPHNNKFFAICHGTRNGFEQNYIASKINVDIIGTDISETASQFEKSIQWDFHECNDVWVGKCNFIYTNSLDQSWKPQLAVSTWLDQLKKGGLLFIEHTEAHGPCGAGEMDPFGVNPYYMPYLLADWFGHRIALEIIKSSKSNIGSRVWLFVLKCI
jgi:hypothetical protein